MRRGIDGGGKLREGQVRARKKAIARQCFANAGEQLFRKRILNA